MRGAIRGLPWWGVTAVAVTAVVIGWCLPLFGVSLAAFLVVDAVIASRKQKRDV